MLGSFDECKGSASLIQSLLHSLPMTAKIVHETFLLYLVIFFIDHKNITNSLSRIYTKTQKSSTTQENGLETKLPPPKKGISVAKKCFFLHPSPSNPFETPVPSSPRLPTVDSIASGSSDERLGFLVALHSLC